MVHANGFCSASPRCEVRSDMRKNVHALQFSHFSALGATSGNPLARTLELSQTIYDYVPIFRQNGWYIVNRIDIIEKVEIEYRLIITIPGRAVDHAHSLNCLKGVPLLPSMDLPQFFTLLHFK